VLQTIRKPGIDLGTNLNDDLVIQQWPVNHFYLYKSCFSLGRYGIVLDQNSGFKKFTFQVRLQVIRKCLKLWENQV
jgi:hypothetical protein